jgi:hypothetical protein
VAGNPAGRVGRIKAIDCLTSPAILCRADRHLAIGASSVAVPLLASATALPCERLDADSLAPARCIVVRLLLSALLWALVGLCWCSVTADRGFQRSISSATPAASTPGWSDTSTALMRWSVVSVRPLPHAAAGQTAPQAAATARRATDPADRIAGFWYTEAVTRRRFRRYD